MSSLRERLSGLKQCYEKVIAVFVLLAVGASSVYLALRLQEDQTMLQGGSISIRQPDQRVVHKLDVSKWNEQMEQRSQPFQSDVASGRMVVSELRVRCVNESCQKPIPYDAAVCPFCGTEQPEADSFLVDSDGDSIPDDQEKKHGLDPFDPSDVLDDPDGDGFVSREEYQLEQQQWLSDPQDAASFPPPAWKVRLVKLKARPFKMQFKGVQDLPDGARYQLNMGGNSKFAKMNEALRIRGRNNDVETYTVVGYEPRVKEVKGRKVDVSILELEGKGRRYQLIKNRPVTAKNIEALLVFLIEKRPIKVKLGSEFDIKGYTYKVVDMNRDGVLLEDARTAEKIQVERITPEEISRLRRSTKEK